jgi:hypothetical protein
MATDIAFAWAHCRSSRPARQGTRWRRWRSWTTWGRVVLRSLSTIVGCLAMDGLVLLILTALNVLRVRHLMPYLVVGIALWFFVHESGVHATIAGVLLAFAIPTRTRINAAEFSARARGSSR